MTLGAKLAVIFLVLGLVPLIALGTINYRSGVGAAESLLRERASERTTRVERKAVHILDAQGTRLLDLSQGKSLAAYVRDSGPHVAAASGQTSTGAQAQGGVDGVCGGHRGREDRALS